MEEDGQEVEGRRRGEQVRSSPLVLQFQEAPANPGNTKLDDYKSIHRGAEADCWWVANAYAQWFWISNNTSTLTRTLPIEMSRGLQFTLANAFRLESLLHKKY